jgi:hypothetical protein
MHSILFAINRPDDNSPQLETWSRVVGGVNSELQTNKDIEPLGKGVWLLKGASPLPYIGRAIETATRLRFPCRILVIEKATDWSPELPPVA